MKIIKNNFATMNLVAIITLFFASPCFSASFGKWEADRVLFLGDSITHAGHYISIIETQLRQVNDNQVPEIINLGLPSETCSGLSEPDHPFPRPNVHERLDRALEKIKPDLVIACYGMNDGIYHPFNEERFHAYQAGIKKLVEKVTSSGAKIILVTPPPFDPLPLKKKGKLLPANTDKNFAWFQIYENYDADVIARYAKWIMKQQDQVEKVIDVYHPITSFVNVKRKDDADFVLSGDGVHINNTGHEILASAIWKELGLPGEIAPKPELLSLVSEKQKLMKLAWLTHVRHKRPGPNSKLTLKQAREKEAELNRRVDELFAN